MFRRTLALAAAAIGVSAGFPAQAADAPGALKPLRTMVFDTAYSIATLRHEQTSGFTHNANGTMGSVAGAGQVDRRFTVDDRASITVAVIAATRDGGLVVDSTYAGHSSSHPPIRIAIFKNGGLSYDPTTPLTAEEIRLLPFLARGFIAERTIAPGEAWTVTPTAPVTGTTTYRVSHVESDRATLAIDGTMSVRGPAGYDEHSEGTTVYAVDVLMPLSVDIKAHLRRQVNSDENDVIDAHLVATLVHDSFGKR